VKTSEWPINIPNILTVGRILLTPLFVILLIKSLFAHALIVFTLAGISDGLDGFIARYFNQRTVMGSYLDPIADKFLLSAAFITLAILTIIPAWITVIVISRDILILVGIAVFAITDFKVNIKPSIVSKFTTAAQLGTIFIVLLGFHIPAVVIAESPALWITAGLTILSGLHYMLAGVSILQAGLENTPPRP
jgi:cardiolipin synthase (CMP-forming)